MNDKNLEVLRGRMFHLLCYKPYNSNRNHVNKLAAQIHYLENIAAKGKEAE